jgi:hypothetical protein
VWARPCLLGPQSRQGRAQAVGYGVDEARWRFVQGDVFEALESAGIEVDLVVCLGFFYHTLRHHELLTRIRQTGAGSIVMDTEIHRSGESIMRVGHEFITRQGNAVADEFSFGDIVLTGRPSVPALELLGRRAARQPCGRPGGRLPHRSPGHLPVPEARAHDRPAVSLTSTT